MNCKQAHHALCEAQDAKLPLVRRLALRWHLVGCVHCSRFRQQLNLLRRAVQRDRDGN